MLDRSPALVQLLKAQGWPIHAVEVLEGGLKVRSDRIGREAVITGFGPSLLEQSTVSHGPGQAFIRIEIGAPVNVASRWGTFTTEELNVQIVGSAEGLSLSAGLMASSPLSAEEVDKLRALFRLASRLGQEHLGAEGAWTKVEWPYEEIERPLIQGTGRGQKVGGSAAIASSIAGSAGVLLAMPELWGLTFYPALGLALFGLATFSRGALISRAVLGAHEQGRPALAALRASEALDEVDPESASLPQHFQVLRWMMGQTYWGLATLRTVTLRARSIEQELSLTLRLNALTWPPNVLPLCQLLPDSWATAEVRGAPAALAQTPSREGELREAERVRWQMGHDELRGGALVDWLLRLDAALRGASAGPYR